MVFCVPSPVLNTRNTLINEPYCFLRARGGGRWQKQVITPQIRTSDEMGIGFFGTPENTPTLHQPLRDLIASRELGKTVHIL